MSQKTQPGLQSAGRYTGHRTLSLPGPQNLPSSHHVARWMTALMSQRLGESLERQEHAGRYCSERQLVHRLLHVFQQAAKEHDSPGLSLKLSGHASEAHRHCLWEEKAPSRRGRAVHTLQSSCLWLLSLPGSSMQQRSFGE